MRHIILVINNWKTRMKYNEFTDFRDINKIITNIENTDYSNASVYSQQNTRVVETFIYDPGSEEMVNPVEPLQKHRRRRHHNKEQNQESAKQELWLPYPEPSSTKDILITHFLIMTKRNNYK